jgi:hypothetical protein
VRIHLEQLDVDDDFGRALSMAEISLAGGGDRSGVSLIESALVARAARCAGCRSRSGAGRSSP